MKKFYKLSMILLPLFVGNVALINLIFYLSNQKTFMNTIFSTVFFLLGYFVGIRNILELMKETN
ncbi:hypothetical protein [Peptostreptococcus stomatis]|uniref:hypothetical protein n=1 Tax=Peptostreptococcus stomatis TaxID=341694 RepID=UPI0028EEEDF7|nr:hypothetical protein [Peptostreptococcus stomatis]